MRYCVILLSGLFWLSGCGMERSQRIEIAATAAIAGIQPLTTTAVRELEDDDLVDVGVALQKLHDGVGRVNEIVQLEIDGR